LLGGIDDAEALAKSNPFGVTTVLTVCPERVQHKASGVNYLQFPVEDARRIPVAQFDAIIDALWENVRWGKVLVHCVAGLSRSPIIVASWMHVVGYADIDEALAEINRLRPIDPSPILLKSVKELL
jgi:protein-tyrosine phosphatase